MHTTPPCLGATLLYLRAGDQKVASEDGHGVVCAPENENEYAHRQEVNVGQRTTNFRSPGGDSAACIGASDTATPVDTAKLVARVGSGAMGAESVVLGAHTCADEDSGRRGGAGAACNGGEPGPKPEQEVVCDAVESGPKPLEIQQGVAYDVCGIWFASYREEREHWEWLAPREEQWQCGGCSRSFGNERALSQHSASCRKQRAVKLE